MTYLGFQQIPEITRLFINHLYRVVENYLFQKHKAFSCRCINCISLGVVSEDRNTFSLVLAELGYQLHFWLSCWKSIAQLILIFSLHFTQDFRLLNTQFGLFLTPVVCCPVQDIGYYSDPSHGFHGACSLVGMADPEVCSQKNTDLLI